MCIEIIANQQNLFCVWEMHIHYISADMCEINASALVSDFNMSNPSRGAKIMNRLLTPLRLYSESYR